MDPSEIMIEKIKLSLVINETQPEAQPEELRTPVKAHSPSVSTQVIKQISIANQGIELGLRLKGGDAVFYGVRAPASIVGEDNTGVFTTWDEVKKNALHGTSQVRAAMHGNYKKFKTREEAENYAQSPPELFTNVKQFSAIAKYTIVVFGAVTGLCLLAMMSAFVYDYNQCSSDYLNTNIYCRWSIKGRNIIIDYQDQLYYAVGSGCVSGLGLMISKVLNFINQ